MGKVDIATKQYMSHRDVIADAFNFYVYDGRQVIKPERLQKLDTTEVLLPYGNDADIAIQKLRDNLILWSMAMDARQYMLCWELKIRTRFIMPWQ